MSEDSKFADGYEAIFGKKQAGAKASKKTGKKALAAKSGTKKSAKKK